MRKGFSILFVILLTLGLCGYASKPIKQAEPLVINTPEPPEDVYITVYDPCGVVRMQYCGKITTIDKGGDGKAMKIFIVLPELP